MRPTLLVLGALAGIALAVLGVSIVVDAIRGFDETRIEETRTALPGSRTAELEEGKYVVFYEVADDSVGDVADGEFPIPALEVSLQRGGSGPALDLDDYSTNFDVSSDGRAARAYATVEVPEAGAYEITAAAGGRASEPAVVLGRPVTGRIFRLITGLAGAAGGLGLVALVCALGIALALRKRPDPS